MSFKVKDLALVVAGPVGVDDTAGCTGWTEPCKGSAFWRDGKPSRQRDLAVLRSQLRQAVARV